VLQTRPTLSPIIPVQFVELSSERLLAIDPPIPTKWTGRSGPGFSDIIALATYAVRIPGLGSADDHEL
jgi:hypothetical protein